MTDARALVLAGPRASILERPNTTITVSSENTKFPKSRLYDRQPGQEFRHNAAAEDDYAFADINQILNGDLSAQASGTNDPEDWDTTETGTGTVVQSSSQVVLSNGASGDAQIAQSFVVLSSERAELRILGQTNNADSPIEVEVQNLTTKKFLASDGTWKHAQQNAGTYTETAETGHTLAFTVETAQATQKHEMTLRIRLHMDNAAATRSHTYQHALYVPAVLALSVHNHNFEPDLAIRFNGTDVSPLTAQPDAALELDGSTNYVTLTSTAGAPLGVSDGDSLTISGWFYADAAGSLVSLLSTPTTDHVQITRTVGNLLRIVIQNAAGTTLVDVDTGAFTLSADTWYHLLFSARTDGAPAARLRIDGTDRLNTTTLITGTMDLTDGGWRLGGDSGGASWDGGLGEWWLAAAFLDFDVAANVSLFRTSGGIPVVLGPAGELADGSASPFFYMKADGTTVANAAGLGELTTTGTLADSIVGREHRPARRPTFFSAFQSPAYKRYWRLHERGTNDSAGRIGQWGLGDAQALIRNPRQNGLEVRETRPQRRAETVHSRETWATCLTDAEQRTLSLEFRNTDAALLFFREEIMRRTKQGAEAMYLIADDTREDFAMFGRVAEVFQHSRQVLGVQNGPLEFTESPQGLGLP